jgi:hypothetical protein
MMMMMMMMMMIYDIFRKICETQFCFKAVIFVSDLRELQ